MFNIFTKDKQLKEVHKSGKFYMEQKYELNHANGFLWIYDGEWLFSEW